MLPVKATIDNHLQQLFDALLSHLRKTISNCFQVSIKIILVIYSHTYKGLGIKKWWRKFLYKLIIFLDYWQFPDQSQRCPVCPSSKCGGDRAGEPGTCQAGPRAARGPTTFNGGSEEEQVAPLSGRGRCGWAGHSQDALGQVRDHDGESSTHDQGSGKDQVWVTRANSLVPR